MGGDERYDRCRQANPPMTRTTRELPAWVPYVAPFGAFLVLSTFEQDLGRLLGASSNAAYPLGYLVKISAVAVIAWCCQSTWKDLRPWPGPAWLAISVALGLVVAGLWMGLDGYYPRFAWLGTRAGFNPAEIGNQTRPPFLTSGLFLAARFFGLVLVVPLIEELFWRSFLMRWLIDPDFEKVPVGEVTPIAAGVTSVLFASAHPEWLPALLTGLIWAGLLWKTKSVGACFVSHVTANLALGLYVLSTGRWEFL
jgi:CAAX prenyl protease-like protein